MRFYGIPLITSIGSIIIKHVTKTSEQILNEIKLVVLDLLKITSLSQTVWHEYVSLMVYEKINENKKAKCIFIKYKSPKGKSPLEYQLTNPAHSFTFISNAWKGYSDQLETYGFNLALEWYIESNASNLDVIKFINATTCLELLISKFSELKLVKCNENEKVMKDIYKKIKKQTKKFLSDYNLEYDFITSILQKMVNRKTYRENIYSLLDYWGIDISDLNTTVEEIVKIRDKIIHRGLYYHNIESEERDKVLYASQDLFTILTRIF
jgi:hypothetical protein